MYSVFTAIKNYILSKENEEVSEDEFEAYSY